MLRVSLHSTIIVFKSHDHVPNSDIGPRVLSHIINNIPGGVTAETCTAACKAAGYGLAGLEYGQECCMSNHFTPQLRFPMLT